jgi:hypothetical protein
MLRLRAPLVSHLVAAGVPLLTACAPALDFDALTSGNGSKGDAAGDSSSPADAGSDSPGDASSSTDACEETAADPCTRVKPADDGLYCGKSTDNSFGCGAPNTLYTCVDGGVSSAMVCSLACIVDMTGFPDTCDECNTKHDGTWCGSEFVNYSSLLANVVFDCQSGVDVGQPVPCAGAQSKCQPNDGGATCVP